MEKIYIGTQAYEQSEMLSNSKIIFASLPDLQVQGEIIKSVIVRKYFILLVTSIMHNLPNKLIFLKKCSL